MPTTSESAAPAAAVDAERNYSLDEALRIAQRLQQADHLDAAEQIYRAVLLQRPGQPDALHFLGILLHQRGDSASAIESIRRAIASMPDEPGPWNNLGNIHVDCGRLGDAVEAYRSCLKVAPDFADALNNLGTVHRTHAEWAEAEACYQRALVVRPDFADAYNNLARLMLVRGRVREAVTFACKALTLLPHDPETRKLLGIAHYTLGEVDEAAAVYREWLADSPDDPIARHHLAACTGEAVPARASDAYVAQTFDAFADSFDAKLQRLAYRAPQLLADAVREIHGQPAAALDVLDAGCGTGLCGPLLRAHARRLEGVDLSARMLGRARQRGVYDKLELGELTAFLAERNGAYDLVVSADTLCYFGELDAFAQAARGAIRTGGWLLFTVEALKEDNANRYALQPHGRYAHASTYVDCGLRARGFDVKLVPEVLRREGGVPVEGWLVRARAAGSQVEQG